MPKCINDPKKTYKGNEPSPKGLGYCAHTETVGTIKTGLDGNKWIISSTTKGIKRWTKYKKSNSENNSKLNKNDDNLNNLIKIYSEKESLKEQLYDDSNKCDCSKFVSYKRNKGRKFGVNYKDIHGLEFEKGKLNKFISYNNFAKKSINIDQEAWIKYELSPDIKQNDFCGTKKKLTKNNPIYKKINHVGYKKYFTYEPYGIDFIVYIKKEKEPIYIYKIPGLYDKIYFPENEFYGKHRDEVSWAYIQLLAKIIPEKIFIGKSEKSIEKYYLYGEKYDGNSILLKINKNQYVFIGYNIYSFTTKSEIIKYVSMVSDNGNVDAFAIDNNNNCYLLTYNILININNILIDRNNILINDNNLDYINIGELYSNYYNNPNEFRKVDNLKFIYNRSI